jgi:hypothetical protein
LSAGSSRCSIKSFGKWPDYEPPTCHCLPQVVNAGADEVIE